MEFFNLYLSEDDNKISDIPGYHYEYKKLKIKECNKYLKTNIEKNLTLFHPILNIKEMDEILLKGIKTIDSNQSLILYSHFTASKVYSGIQEQKVGFIIKLDAAIKKLSVNKEKIKEMKLLYPDINFTLSESLVGANCVKHRGKIYFENIKSIIYINNEENITEELLLDNKNRNNSIYKIREIISKDF